MLGQVSQAFVWAKCPQGKSESLKPQPPGSRVMVLANRATTQDSFRLNRMPFRGFSMTLISKIKRGRLGFYS